MRDFLIESGKLYIELYESRLTKFVTEYEADEIDFIDRELDYFNRTIYDLENSEASHDGFSTTGIGNFKAAYNVVREIGWEKFKYSTKRKTKFLNERKTLLLDQNKTKKVIINQLVTIDQLALTCFYEGSRITRDNGNDILKEYGLNSGEKLFQRFSYWSSRANRIARPHPCTQRKLKNKIDLFEIVIEMLSNDTKQQAIDEVSILKTIYETEYL